MSGSRFIIHSARRHWPFVIILCFFAVAWSFILAVSQRHVHSDEAIIGLMGRHILQGSYFPFYMYGQPYNAGAAGEAYFAVVPFAFFGVGVVPLKIVILMLSLVCLALFYRMVLSLYNQEVATLAALFLALAPSLLKWHFQVRGYSFYFLSIPILTSLFFSVAFAPGPKKVFLFGFTCGVSVWNLELVLTLVGMYWLLLGLWRKLPLRNAAAGIAGLLMGYAPAIIFNLMHGFSNWQFVFGGKTNPSGIFKLSTYWSIFTDELPKFFGPDTVLW